MQVSSGKLARRAKCFAVTGMAFFAIQLTMPDACAAATTMPLNLDQAREAARVTYMIKPDRRFVRAAEFVMQKLADTPTSGSIVLQPAGDRWAASIDGIDLGQIGQLDGFDANLNFVENLAKKHITDRPVQDAESRKKYQELEAEVSNNLGEQLLDVGRKIDALWRDKDSPLPLEAAAKASLHMQMQILYDAGFGEEVAARAIAFLAVQSALREEPLTQHKALLAKFLRYHTEAWQYAQQLPDNEVKMYINDKGADLFALANKPDASLATWYLGTKLSLNNNSRESLQALLQRREDLRPTSHLLVLAPIIPYVAEWDTRAQLALQMAGSLAAQLNGNGTDNQTAENSEEELLFPLYLKGVNRLQDSSQGPLVDRQLVVTFYDTAFCNLVEVTMDFFFDRLGSLENAREVGSLLGVVNEGQVGEYSRLMQARLKETGEGESSLRLQKMLDGFQYIGADNAFRIYNKIHSNYESLMPEPVQAGVTMMNLLDGRPYNHDHIEDVFTVRSFRDLAVTERIKEAKASPACQYNIADQASLHLFRGDKEQLLKALENPHISDSVRAAYAVNHLTKDPNFTTASLEKMIKEVHEKNPTHSGITNSYVKFLKDDGRLDEAIEIQTAYANSQATKSDLSYPHARTSLA